jgi:hypothetical protein
VALVEGGEPLFTIVWDSRAEDAAPLAAEHRPVREAVRTLRREIYFCTGRYVAVADVRERGKFAAGPVLLVGPSAVTRRLGIDPRGLPPEGFVVTTFSNGVAIVGNDSSTDPSFPRPSPLLRLGPRRATLWGAYDFLERFLGCRYYYPGPDGCVHPRCSELSLGPCAYTDAPRFKNRRGAPRELEVVSRTVERNLVGAHVENYLAASRAAFTEPFVSMHSPMPDQWAAANSNLVGRAFMGNLGGELYFCPTNHHLNYYDVTNLDFADDLVRSHERLYASNGARREGLLFSNERYCVFGQCDAFCPLDVMLSKDAVKREGLVTASHLALGSTAWYADVYGRFYHRLADGLARRLPGKRLVVLPYAGCVYPPLLPRYRRLPDNVEAGVCLAKMPRFVRNPEARRVSVDIMRRWQAAFGGRPVRQIWTYNAGNTCFEHAVANEFLPEMVAAFGDSLGDVGINVETGIYPSPVPDFAVCLHFYYGTYCVFRAQWGGAAFDPAAALDEHWRLFYGEHGGGLLRKLHSTLMEAFLSVSVKNARSGSVYPPEVLDAIAARLRDARCFFDGCGNDLWRRRFRLMSYPLFFELDRQRAIHSGVLKPPRRMRYVAGDE